MCHDKGNGKGKSKQYCRRTRHRGPHECKDVPRHVRGESNLMGQETEFDRIFTWPK